MHRSHHRGGPRCGPRRMDRFPGNRDEWLARLEDYQRDLEQRTADVADLHPPPADRPAETAPAGDGLVAEPLPRA